MDFILVLGLVAATLTTAAGLPQLLKSLKTKHTKDLSVGMFSVLTVGVGMWLIYGILVMDIPLIAANSITFIITASILALKLKYK